MHTRTVIALIAAAALFAGDASLDLVVLKEKGKSYRLIVSETLEEMRWKSSLGAGSAENKTNMREVKSVTYAFQLNDGPFLQAMAARDRGKYEEAAEIFAQLASGAREAEQLMGSIEEGGCWEMAGKWDDAAKAFQKVVDGFPKHPRWLDAVYRLGMAYAQGGKKAEASELIKKLEALNKDAVLGQAARVRGFAIQAALFQAENNPSKVREFQSKAQFNPETERPVWLHFNLYLADGLRAQGNGKAAAPIYERMLPFLEDDVSSRARVKLGAGLSKLETDLQGAVIDLLELDALPGGSPEQKCEARLYAGKVIWDDSQRITKEAGKDERKLAFAAESVKAARLVLEAAANAPVSIPAKAKAAELLASLPKEVAPAPAAEEKKDEPKKDEPKKDEAKKDEPKKDAPKP